MMMSTPVITTPGPDRIRIQYGSLYNIKSSRFFAGEGKKGLWAGDRHPVPIDRERNRGVLSFRFPLTPAASCGRQYVDNCLENRDDNVKEHSPVKHSRSPPFSVYEEVFRLFDHNAGDE